MPESSKLSFCPTLDDIVRAGGSRGRSGKLHDSGGLSSVNNLLTLRALHLALRPMRTLEIGLCLGGSTLAFLQSHHDLGNPATHQHVAIDPYQRSRWDEAGLIAVEKAGLTGYLDFREDYSCFELSKLARQSASFQIIYVDGSHLFEDVFLDLFFSARILDVGGMILFDDSTDPHVAKVLSFIRKNMRHGLVEKDLSQFRPNDSPAWKYRTARFLHKIQLTGFEKIASTERDWNASFSNF